MRLERPDIRRTCEVSAGRSEDDLERLTGHRIEARYRSQGLGSPDEHLEVRLIVHRSQHSDAGIGEHLEGAIEELREMLTRLVTK